MHQYSQQEAAQPREESNVDLLTATTPSFSLIVWNDEVNTFE